MSAPPIMLFSLWPAITTARRSRSVASAARPSRTPLTAAEPRILREPALHIVSRTTPRGSRSMPQAGLIMSMGGLAVSGHFPAEPTACQAVVGWDRPGRLQRFPFIWEHLVI